MIRLLVLALFLFAIPDFGNARAFKLSEMGNPENRPKKAFSDYDARYANQEISCFENSDCSFDTECVALRCERVCKYDVCPSGSFCVPAGERKPHEYKCVRCVIDMHCPQNHFCDRDFTCKKADPCEKAVCSPAAPFCMPKPYKSLPYTCVQCLDNTHCPPVAGLTRRCVDGYCLFNVDGNLPPDPAAKQQPASPEDRGKDVYDEYDDDEYIDEYGDGYDD